MNRLPLPEIDDQTALNALANNPKVRSHPDLRAYIPAILQGYAQYVAAQGNAFAVGLVGMPKAIEAHLKAHYADPPNDLRFISDLRETSDYAVCPMCGSLHSGTLDHLLPQDGFAAFAVFSRNLVPACKCNSKRRNVVTGDEPGERILHPYFDDCLGDRLVKARFSDLGPVPRVEICLCVDERHPDYAAIAFHFRTVVERTSILGYLRDRWTQLCRKPSLVVRALEVSPATLGELTQILEKELALLDAIHHGKNNWNSIFVAGLRDPDVLAWLLGRLSPPEREPDGKLA